MKKAELVEDFAKSMKTSKADSERCVNALLDVMKKGLKKDKKIQLIGFGTFSVTKRKARLGRNPRTGEEIKIPASKTVSFKVGKAMKDSL